MAALISQRSRCSQTSKAWRGLLSASVDPHLPPAENHPHAQMASFGVAYSHHIQYSLQFCLWYFDAWNF